jgi:hypothetical protein
MGALARAPDKAHISKNLIAGIVAPCPSASAQTPLLPRCAGLRAHESNVSCREYVFIGGLQLCNYIYVVRSRQA